MPHLSLHSNKAFFHQTNRTRGTKSLQVIGTDFAGPIMYRNKNRGEKKANILLFTCSLTRVIHLELLPFIRASKRLIARRGCPETIYSDNTKTYVAAPKWIKKIKKCIKWKFIIVEHLGWVDSVRECLVY